MKKNNVLGARMAKLMSLFTTNGVSGDTYASGTGYSRSPLPSRRELIERHSKARVLVASNKVFVTKWGTDEKGEQVPTGFSRPLTDADVRADLARKLGAR